MPDLLALPPSYCKVYSKNCLGMGSKHCVCKHDLSRGVVQMPALSFARAFKPTTLFAPPLQRRSTQASLEGVKVNSTRVSAPLQLERVAPQTTSSLDYLHWLPTVSLKTISPWDASYLHKSIFKMDISRVHDRAFRTSRKSTASPIDAVRRNTGSQICLEALLDCKCTEGWL